MKKFDLEKTLSLLKVGQVWRNDWNHPFSNPWNARIIDIKEDGNLLVDEWLAGDTEKGETSWWCGNFVVFYTRLIYE